MRNGFNWLVTWRWSRRPAPDSTRWRIPRRTPAPADRIPCLARRMPWLAADSRKEHRPPRRAPTPRNEGPRPACVDLRDGEGACFPTTALDGFEFTRWRETDSPLRAREKAGGGRTPSERLARECVWGGTGNSVRTGMQTYPASTSAHRRAVCPPDYVSDAPPAPRPLQGTDARRLRWCADAGDEGRHGCADRREARVSSHRRSPDRWHCPGTERATRLPPWWRAWPPRKPPT
jgi:hypothetical protein